MIVFLIYLVCYLAYGCRILFSKIQKLFIVKRISATVAHIDLRLQQICFWPWEYTQWLLCENKLTPLAQAQYIG